MPEDWASGVRIIDDNTWLGCAGNSVDKCDAFMNGASFEGEGNGCTEFPFAACYAQSPGHYARVDVGPLPPDTAWEEDASVRFGDDDEHALKCRLKVDTAGKMASDCKFAMGEPGPRPSPAPSPSPSPSPHL